MFGLGSSLRFYPYAGVTDMRKNFDGLGGLVQSKLDRSPTSGEVFIFINRRRDRVKLLRWETGGFVLYYKRLEQWLHLLRYIYTDCQMFYLRC